MLTQRVRDIQPSLTLGITALVNEMKRDGKSVIGLGAGEPDFDTPEVIKEAAVQAIQEGFTKYTPVSGIIELKEAVCDNYRRDTKQEFSPAEVLISNGAKHSLANAMLALCEAGDEIIIPVPYWTSYIELARFVRSTPVLLNTNESTDFKISAEQLEAAITPKTKLLLLNSPCNPTGTVYSHVELAALVEVIKRHDFYIIYDEIYDKIIYNGHEHVSLAIFPEIRERLILINGVSKSYAMTGWRIGYMLAPKEIVAACNRLQGHTTSNPCSIAQRAALAALRADRRIIDEMLSAFAERREYFAGQLAEMPGVECTMPGGAFYMFPNVASFLGHKWRDKSIASPMDLCAFLLEEEGVALIPGEAFGSNRHVRISYATSLDNLKEASVRITRGLEKLRAGD